jgi:chromosome segregation ATPase
MENRTLVIIGGVAIATALYFKMQSDRLQQLEIEHAREQAQIDNLKKSLESEKQSQTQQANDTLATEVDSLHRLQESLKIQQDALNALKKERDSLNLSAGKSIDELKADLKSKTDLVRDLEARLKNNRDVQAQLGQHTKLVYANESEDKKERHQQRKAQMDWHVQSIRTANGQIAILSRQKYSMDKQTQINALRDQVSKWQAELAQLRQDEDQDSQYNI